VFRRFFFTCAITSCTLLAHSDSAIVSGSVFDGSGAVVKDAKIILHRTNGAVSLATASDNAGRFMFNSVTPGDYLLEASAPGLTLKQSQDLQIQSGERKEIKLELAIAAISTLVTVTSSGEPQPVDQVAKALDVVDAVVHCADWAYGLAIIVAATSRTPFPGLDHSSLRDRYTIIAVWIDHLGEALVALAPRHHVAQVRSATLRR